MTKIYKMWSSYDQAALCINFEFLHHPRCCATNYLQNGLEIGPQHNIVSLPQATLPGSSVLCRFGFEILVLLLYFFHLILHPIIDICAIHIILLRWMIHNLGDEFLTTILHRLKCIH